MSIQGHVDYYRDRRDAHNAIKETGMIAVLRRSTGDRQCWIVIQDYSPQERDGSMTDPIDRMVLVSALAPDGTVLVAPDREQDRLITYVPETDQTVEDEHLRIAEPPGKLAPGGIVVYWELKVRR